MICPKCGAEIKDDSKVCGSCGYQISYEAENSEVTAPKKRKTWLWVLGWIFIFPLPLTILLLRKKDMKPVIKYGIIAVAWIIYLILVFSAKSDTSAETSVSQEPTQIEETVPLTFVLNSDEQGEYGKQITLNKGTDIEYTCYIYLIPSGKYSVSNNDEKVGTQITICRDEIVPNDDGVEEIGMSDKSPVVLPKGSKAEISISDGECIKLSDGSKNISFEKID